MSAATISAPSLAKSFALPGAIHIPREYARSETTLGVAEDRPDQTTALRTGRSYHCDNFSIAHCDLLFFRSAITRGYV